MAWTTANPDRESRGNVNPDTKMVAEFQDEFEIIPTPDASGHKGVVCNNKNMEYIRSALPMQHVGLQDFYTDMAKREWQPAKPKTGLTNALLRGPRGVMGMPIGGRRALVPNPVTTDTARPMLPRGGASDWKAIPELERVNAYVFRGDKRHPRAIKAANGFHPPSTRKDNAYVPIIARRFTEYMKARFDRVVDQTEIENYIRGKGQVGRIFTEYEVWREILKGEELHIGRMTVDEFLKGYISTTRSIAIASAFAQSASPDGRRDSLVGVYAMHSEGGFLLPDGGLHSHATRHEAEIAHPGPLPWDKIVGFRFKVTSSIDDPRTWQKNSNFVFMRKGFRMRDPQGAYEVLMQLATVFPIFKPIPAG